MPTSPSSWSAFTSTSEASRRAGGRSHYNSMRQFHAAMRRIKVEQLFAEYGFVHGAKARIARELDVSPSTITRDIQRLSGSKEKVCRECERPMSDRGWEQLEVDQSRRACNVLAATRAMSKVA